MKTFILILITHGNGGSAIATQEFNSYQTCESAIELMDRARDKLRVNIEFAMCVEK